MLTMDLKVNCFSIKNSFSRFWGCECHKEPEASQVIHQRSGMFPLQVPSVSDLGLFFRSASAPFCLLPGKGSKLSHSIDARRRCSSIRDHLGLSATSLGALAEL